MLCIIRSYLAEYTRRTILHAVHTLLPGTPLLLSSWEQIQL